MALYLAALAENHKVATIGRRLSAIRAAHAAQECDDPTAHPVVRDVWSGLRRTLGVAPVEKAAVTLPQLRQLVSVQPASLRGLRNRAVLLVGFAGGFRRSELVGLDLVDVTMEDDGMVLRVRRSKTDQHGQGRSVGVGLGQHANTCPVRAVQRWTAAAKITEGPVFRRMYRGDRLSDDRLAPASVARIVKEAADEAGLDPAVVAGHSLRRGFVTAAARAGVAEWQIMRTTGHRSPVTLRRYIEEATAVRDAPTAKIGL